MTAPLTFRDRAVTFSGKTQPFPNRSLGGAVMTAPYREAYLKTVNNNFSHCTRKRSNKALYLSPHKER